MPIDLTEENYDEYIEGKNILLDFTATWCGPCKNMKPEFKKAENFIKDLDIDLTFALVDTDQLGDLAVKYGISSLPTLILLKDGKEVARKRGGQSCEEILMMVGKHFDIKKKEETNDKPKVCVRD